MNDSDDRGKAASDIPGQLAAIGANCPGIVCRRVRYPGGRIEYPYVSAAVHDIYGLEPADIIADPSILLDRLHSEDRDRFESSLQQSATDLAPWFLEFKIIDAAGEVHWMCGNSTPHQGENGEVVWDGLLLDITESKAATKALQGSEQRFRDLIEKSNQGILVHRYDELLFANQTLCDMLGYRRPEDIFAIGSVDAWLPDDERTRIRGYAEARLRGESPPAHYECRVLRRDGSEMWMESHSVVLDWEGVPAILVAFNDIDARKRIENELHGSELRLRALIEGSIQGLVVYRDQKVLFANEECARMLGYDNLEELRSAGSLERHLHPEERDRLKHYGEARVRGEPAPSTYEARALRKDGSVIWLGVRATRIEWDGKPASQSVFVDITQRKRAERELRVSEERFRDMAEASADWFWETDQDLKFTYISPSFAGLGVAPSELIGLTREDVKGERNDPEFPDNEQIAMRSRKPYRGLERRSDVAADRWVRVSARPIFSTDGAFLGYRGTSSDITEHRRREDQLRHTQTMEAIGQLTGGMAHDFNNLLAVIMGNSELLQDQLGTDNELLRIIFRSADRGASLIDRLLSFSRQQPLAPRPVDTSALVAEMGDLLRRTLGETMEVGISSDPNLWHARVDPGQLESALLNLALNARDAMGRSGKMTIVSGNISLDRVTAAAHTELNPGDYVLIMVSDTGAGMSTTVKAHALEPFFTTKDVGEGSGLGLSMVYGFTKQSGGDLVVSSEQGRGTTIKLYLPRADDSGVQRDSVENIETPFGGGEIVLVIEDEPSMRSLAKALLGSLGYQVLTAKDGPDGLEILKKEPKIDLLLSDVMLHGSMSGPEVASEAKRLISDLKVLFMSGYAEGAFSDQRPLPKDTDLLNKPFRRRELAQMVRAALDR